MELQPLLLEFVKGVGGRCIAFYRTGCSPLSGTHFRYLASSWRSWVLSWIILALSGRILSPSCSKMAPRWPNIAQLLAKMSQHSLQEPPTRPPKTPKCGQNAIVMLIFTCRPFLPNSAPRPFKIAKMAPQLASRWRSGAQLGPSWRHLGSILAPSWPTWRYLGPSWRQDAPQ